MLFASMPDGTVTIAEDFIESAVQGRKKGDAIFLIWVNRLEAGTKTWAEVPASRKAAVDAILKQAVADGKITAEQYAEITGYPYD